MRAILVRVGVDQAYGGWNAPSDPKSKQFVYVPIPEKAGTPFQPGLERPYAGILPALRNFSELHGLSVDDFGFTSTLFGLVIHLDPDFEHLTYGDNGERRGAGIKGLAVESQ